LLTFLSPTSTGRQVRAAYEPDERIAGFFVLDLGAP
jgi:hypothetical protein